MNNTIKGFVLVAILVTSLITSLQFGSTFIPLADILNSLWSHLGIKALSIPHMTDTIIWDIRLPRLIYSILTGIGLSAVGLLMQTVTRNALVLAQGPFLQLFVVDSLYWEPIIHHYSQH